MRNSVISRITEMAEKDSRIMLLVGDLGYNVVEGFRDKFPNRFINVGIAEQNMAAVAAGLALSGNMVFTYSIGNFATLRAMEQIRNDICYHHANVKILAVGCGFAYGDLGMTHHATEDIAMMRSLPNMTVYAPSDAKEAVACLEKMCKSDGPAYLRMARGREDDLHEKIQIGDVFHPVCVCEGAGDVIVLTCGTTLSEGIKLVCFLKEDGISAGVYSVPSIKPMDTEFISRISKSCRLIVTLEDHNIQGGFGSAVSEIASEVLGAKARILRIGLRDTFTEISGSQAYLREYYGINAERARERVRQFWYCELG